MKINKILAVAVMLGASLPVMAQFNGGGAGGNDGDNANYHHVSVGYNATMLDPEGSKGITLSGFSAEYNYGINLKSDMPLFLEVGGALGYGTGKKYKLMNLAVPVSVGYKFNFGESFAVMPYTGLSFKINLMAKYDKFNLFSSDGGDGDWEEGDWEDYASRAYDDDEEDWGDYDDYAADYKWKRFQMGWHIGARASYNSWTLGLRYGLDFMEIAKKCSTSTFTVSVGYKF